MRRRRELTFGERFVKLGREISRSGLLFLGKTEGLTGEKRKLADEIDEMIRNSSDSEIEDIARNVLVAFPRFAASIRESEHEGMLSAFLERRNVLRSNTPRDEA